MNLALGLITFFLFLKKSHNFQKLVQKTPPGDRLLLFVANLRHSLHVIFTTVTGWRVDRPSW